MTYLDPDKALTVDSARAIEDPWDERGMTPHSQLTKRLADGRWVALKCPLCTAPSAISELDNVRFRSKADGSTQTAWCCPEHITEWEAGA